MHGDSAYQTIDCYLRGYGKQVTMTKEGYFISQLSEGVGGPDMLQR